MELDNKVKTHQEGPISFEIEITINQSHEYMRIVATDLFPG